MYKRQEYYTPVDNKAHLYQRRFFNEDGSVAYDEIVDGKDSVFRFPDKLSLIHISRLKSLG